MTAQVLFFYVFLFEKDLHLNAIEGAKNISAVSSAKNSKYENLTDKKILPCGKSQIIEQVNFRISPLGKKNKYN